MLSTVFMFPGQGAQQVGMGRDLADADEEISALYAKASGLAGFDLAEVCFEGPQERLDTTENSQPAIFVTSVACLMALRKGLVSKDFDFSSVSPDICAGLSLGEYTALYAAGAVGFSEAFELVCIRGRAMQQAAAASGGAMVTILGADSEQVNALCCAVLGELDSGTSDSARICPVNYNCPGQIVLSGTVDACHLAVELAASYGAIKAIPLRVGGAFHTDLMSPAADRLQKAIESCKFTTPKCPVIANSDAKPYQNIAEFQNKLLKQLVSPVLWQQSVEYMLEQGADRFVEIGPGRVLTGLVKKIARAKKIKVEIITINSIGA